FHEVHERALSLAKEFKRVQVGLLDVLGEIDAKKVFRHLGFGSLWDYCLKGLCLSPCDTETLIRVLRKSQDVPELKKAVQTGQINLSAARKICSVINRKNQSEWIQKAHELPQKALEIEIVKENPKAKIADKLKPMAPEVVELHCCVSGKTEKLIRRVQDLESKRQGRNVSLEDILHEM